MSSLEATEKECAANAVAPRVSLKDIEDAKEGHFFFTGDDAAKFVHEEGGVPSSAIQALKLLTVCIIVMRNGFTVIGKSACASPENFNPALGQKLAYEDAVRQVWPLMGFNLRQKLWDGMPVGPEKAAD